MRVSERWPRFAGGVALVDTRSAPSLRNVVGSRIYLRSSYADDHLRTSRHFAPDAAAYLHVVPVESDAGEATTCTCCDRLAFAVDHLDADGVVVAANGYVRPGGGIGGDV